MQLSGDAPAAAKPPADHIVGTEYAAQHDDDRT